jgi:RyR domain
MSQPRAAPRKMTRQHLAKVAYEAMRAYNQTLGVYSEKPWDQLAEPEQNAHVQRVAYRLDNPGAPDAALHDQWVMQMFWAGWRWGEVRNQQDRTHPELMPFTTLPEVDQYREKLFAAIVRAMAEATA